MIRSPEQMRQTRLRLRWREVAAALGRVPDERFDAALEIGAGDGSQSALIARCAKKVISTDLNPDRLQRESTSKVRFQVCDCQKLPFEDNAFDLVYSSNVFEHLPDPSAALACIHRVLRDDGVAVIIVPNRMWKVTQLVLFYPHKLLTLLEVLASSRRRRIVGQPTGRGNNLGQVPPSFIARNRWPTVHGVSPNHAAEFAQFASSQWTRTFQEGGFDVVGRVRGLPFHSPYRFGYERLRHLFERVGLSSTTGFVLVKTGCQPDALRFFDVTSEPSASESELR